MGDIALAGSTSGTITLTPTAVAGSNTLTLPAATGTVMVSGNMPTFYAYKSGGNQSVTAGVWTVVTLESEVWDTASCFASNKFTPNVAGYYQVNGSIAFTGYATDNRAIISFWKNGSEYSRCQDMSMTNLYGMQGSSLIYLNGTTDYVELRTYLGTNGTVLSATQENTFMNGCLVRAA